MRAELANLNHCAVPFSSRAAVNLSWYDSTLYSVYTLLYKYKPRTTLTPKVKILLLIVAKRLILHDTSTSSWPTICDSAINIKKVFHLDSLK